MGLDAADIARLGPDAQRQIMDKLGAQERERRSKYHNKPETRGALRFASRKEARRYDELMLQLGAGMIRDLRLQPQFTLVEGYVTPEGKRVRATRYVADFSYERASAPGCAGEVHWAKIVEDVKSSATRTSVYRFKKKLMLDRFGIDVKEV